MSYRIEILRGSSGVKNPDIQRDEIESALRSLMRSIDPDWKLRTANLLMDDGTMVTITKES